MDSILGPSILGNSHIAGSSHHITSQLPDSRTNLELLKPSGLRWASLPREARCMDRPSFLSPSRSFSPHLSTHTYVYIYFFMYLFIYTEYMYIYIHTSPLPGFEGHQPLLADYAEVKNSGGFCIDLGLKAGRRRQVCDDEQLRYSCTTIPE